MGDLPRVILHKMFHHLKMCDFYFFFRHDIFLSVTASGVLAEDCNIVFLHKNVSVSLYLFPASLRKNKLYSFYTSPTVGFDIDSDFVVGELIDRVNFFNIIFEQVQTESSSKIDFNIVERASTGTDDLSVITYNTPFQ